MAPILRIAIIGLDYGARSRLQSVIGGWLGNFRPESCLGDANYVKNRKQRHEQRWNQA
jgi:hypothetical protein